MTTSVAPEGIENQARLRLLTEQVPTILFKHLTDGVIVTDPNQRIVDWNPAAESMFGYSQAEMLGSTPYLLHGDGPGGSQEIKIKAALEREGRWAGEFWFRRKDGTEGFCETAIVAVRDERGQLAAFIGVNRDITRRKRAEAALQRATEELEQKVQERTREIQRMNQDLAREVEQHKRAEQALRESEERYRNLVESARDVIYTMTIEGVFTSLNPVFENILGFSREEWLGRHFAALVHPEDLPQAMGVLQMVVQGGTPPVIELRIATTSNDYRFAEMTVTAQVRDGSVVSVLGIARDVTERKRAELALRESEERYRRLVEMSPDAIGVAVDGKAVFINAALARLLGATDQGQILGKRIFEFVPASFRGTVARRIRGILEEGQSAPIEVEKLTRLDGTVVDVEVAATGILYQHKPAVLVVFRDITERKRAEEELRRSETRNRAILDAVPDLIFRLTREGRYLDFKAASREELLVEPEAFLGKTVWEVMPARFARKVMESIETTLRTCAMQVFEYQLPIRGAFREYEARLVPSGEDEVLAIVRNITEQKRLERQILEISDREQRRLGQDLHDELCQQLIGTAFTSKILEQKLAEKSLPEAADAREIAVMIEQGIARARNLARGLYPVQLEKEGLAVGLEQLAANVHSLFRVPCSCEFDPQVRIDDLGAATHLYRIAQEAINNGIKHGKAKQVRLGLKAEGPNVKLTIEDNGVGFPKIVRHSEGMGLNIMRYRARMIGGALDIRRAGARGTIVTCTMPRPDANDGRSGKPGSQNPV